MANYTAAAHSNYFRVKDREAFMEWVESVEDLDCWSEPLDGVEHFTLMSTGQGWPSETADRQTGEVTEVDVVSGLAGHLAEGSVAVLFESGAEVGRYVFGYGVAVHPSGEVVRMSLEDIYGRARAAFGAEAEIHEGME